MIVGVKIPGIGGGFSILSDFGELSLCGPYGCCHPCFPIHVVPVASHIDGSVIINTTAHGEKSDDWISKGRDGGVGA